MIKTASNAPPAIPDDWLKNRQTLSLDDASPCWIARAPGRLDIMGGIADYTGGLVASLLLDRGVWGAAQQRTDGQLALHLQSDPTDAPTRNTTLTMNDFFDRSGPRQPRELADRIGQQGDTWCLPVVGVLHAWVTMKLPGDLNAGLTVAIRSELLAASGLATVAATQVALVEALAALFDTNIAPKTVRDICRHASATVCGFPGGDLDPLALLLGRHDTLMAVDNDSAESPRFVPVPGSIRFVGIDSNATHRLAETKQRQTRTTAAMGARVIDRVRTSAKPGAASIGLRLAEISTADFVNLYRDRIPTRMKGVTFIERFGDQLPDADPTEPDFFYKIRSRTEHHIYENQRCRDFVEMMERIGDAPHADLLTAAGQLMYNSHWSYGQRCGLGTTQADILVNLLTKAGIEHGIFGARITGAGAGGMIVVMMADGQQAQDALTDAIDQYQNRTGRKPTLYEPGGCAALQWKPRQL